MRFAHAVVGDAVLEDVPVLRRARMHADVADAIEAGDASADDVAEIVAGHRVEAVSLGQGDRAAAALERAAGVAVRRYAYAAADDLLDRALALRRAAGGTPQALQAELATVGALIELRRNRYGHAYEGRAELFARADELARRLERLESYSALLWAEFIAAGTTCELEVAELVARQLLTLAQESDEPAVRMLGHSGWGVLCWHYGRLTESRDHLQLAVDLLRADADGMYQRLPATLAGSDALIRSFYGLVVALTGDADRAAALFAALRRDHEEPAQRLTIEVFAAVAAAAVGDVGRDPGRGRRARDRPGWAGRLPRRLGRRPLGLGPASRPASPLTGSSCSTAPWRGCAPPGCGPAWGSPSRSGLGRCWSPVGPTRRATRSSRPSRRWSPRTSGGRAPCCR